MAKANRINQLTLGDIRPEKAGVGGSIPSLATTFSNTYRFSLPRFCSILFQSSCSILAALSERAGHSKLPCNANYMVYRRDNVTGTDALATLALSQRDSVALSPKPTATMASDSDDSPSTALSLGSLCRPEACCVFFAPGFLERVARTKAPILADFFHDGVDTLQSHCLRLARLSHKPRTHRFASTIAKRLACSSSAKTSPVRLRPSRWRDKDHA